MAKEFEFQAIRVTEEEDGYNLYRRTPKNEYLVEFIPKPVFVDMLGAFGIKPEIRVIYDGAAKQIRIAVDHQVIACVPVERGAVVTVGKEQVNTSDLPMSDGQFI